MPVMIGIEWDIKRFLYHRSSLHITNEQRTIKTRKIMAAELHLTTDFIAGFV